MSFSEVCVAIAPLGADWALVLLLALSVACQATMLERGWFFWQRRINGEHLTRQLFEWFRSGNLHKARNVLLSRNSPECIVLAAGISQTDHGSQASYQAMLGACYCEQLRMQRYCGMLVVLGNGAMGVAVIGVMLKTIQIVHWFMQTGADRLGSWQELTCQALATLVIGLLVSIPAAMASTFFDRRINSTLVQINSFMHLLLAHLAVIEATENKNDAELPQAA